MSSAPCQPISMPSPPEKGPEGFYLVDLVIYPHPGLFKDHWAIFVRSHENSQVGLYLHANGDVLNGFTLELKRFYDFTKTRKGNYKRTPLQWVDGMYFDEAAMFNNKTYVNDNKPVCGFEVSAMKVPAPGPSLRSVARGDSGKKIVQKNCQTWIVEAADQLVRDGIFDAKIADYLHSIKQ